VPDDSWQNKESRLDHLQPFGCQVFYRDHRNPSKLAPRYKEGLLMGFVDGTHNYRIWDTKSNSVITSRDVVFHHSQKVILLQTSDQKLCKYQTTILLRQQKCLYHHNGSFYANSPELINKKHYDQSQTISMMMIRLIYNLLTKAASIHISFQRMLSLQAQ